MKTLRGWRVCIALAALCALTAQALSAQAIRGQVMLPDSVTPAAGAIAIATDDRDRAVGRALTHVRGQFFIALPAPGSYVVRVLRIGYHPTVLPARSVAASDTASVRTVLNAQPVLLAAMNVREQETCRVGADTGLAVARVWEEARKAMLSSQLKSDDAPLRAEWVEYDRSYDAAGRSMRAQEIRLVRHPTNHAFKSLPAAVLDSGGYVTTDSVGINFYAPDADVLLSPGVQPVKTGLPDVPCRAGPVVACRTG